MVTIAHDPFIDIAEPTSRSSAPTSCGAGSDVVTLHAPATPSTHHVVDATALAAMPADRSSSTAPAARSSTTTHFEGARPPVTSPAPGSTSRSPSRSLPTIRSVATRGSSSLRTSPRTTAVGRLRLYRHAIDNALRRARRRARSLVPEQCDPGEEHVVTTLRERWAGGARTLGAWLAIPSIVAAETTARTGFDYVCADLQHGCAGLRRLRRSVPSGPDRRFDADRARCRGTNPVSSARSSTPVPKASSCRW